MEKRQCSRVIPRDCDAIMDMEEVPGSCDSGRGCKARVSSRRWTAALGRGGHPEDTASRRAKQEPFKASQVGSPTRRKLDVEGDWLQMQQDGAEERENSKGRVGSRA